MSPRMPISLFKYVRFGSRLMEQLCYDNVYYADPGNFNDPLDCLPVVNGDLPVEALKQLLAQMIMRRSAKEIDAALRRLRLRGENATARRDVLTENAARELLGRIEYGATHPDVEDRDSYYRLALIAKIEQELRQGFQTGVLCLSTKFNSPLMWSHYADQHHGICIEYDVSGIAPNSLHRVRYGESREVLASQIRDWIIADNPDTRGAIERACLLTKSKEWGYECEWRLIGPQGLHASPARLKSVIFGMRCSDAIRYTVARALQGRGDGLKFWSITLPLSDFALKRHKLDVDELVVGMPQISCLPDFDDLTGFDSPQPSNNGM